MIKKTVHFREAIVSYDMTQNYFNFYFFSLLIFISNAEWNPKDFQKREHSLVKPFTGTLCCKM